MRPEPGRIRSASIVGWRHRHDFRGGARTIDEVRLRTHFELQR
jgi:hypothetical protein